MSVQRCPFRQRKKAGYPCKHANARDTFSRDLGPMGMESQGNKRISSNNNILVDELHRVIGVGGR